MSKLRDDEKALALRQALEARSYWLERAEKSKTREEFAGCIKQATYVDAKIRKLDPQHKLRDKAFSDPNATPAVLGTGIGRGYKGPK